LRTLTHLLKTALPSSARDRLREVRRGYRRALHRAGTATGRLPVVTATDLVDGFRKLGLRAGDLVMAHSSLRSLGHVEGGAETVVSALRALLGEAGTLVVPTLSFDGNMWTHFESYDDAAPFDARSTPSRVGKITEIVRTTPGSFRSVHASHSVAAIGPKAADLTSEHHLDAFAFGRRSPYFKLCEAGGKILMLGVDLTTMTAVHVIENIVDDYPLPVHMPQAKRVEVILPSGARHTMDCKVHNPEISAIRDCNKIEPFFREYGILEETRIGNARVMLIDASRLIETMQSLLARGITIYTPRA
jgi:aminoglycoside 3-N-acetyltransferase